MNCKKCGDEITLKNMGRTKNECKICYNDYVKGWRNKNKLKYNVYMKNYMMIMRNDCGEDCFNCPYPDCKKSLYLL